MPSDPFTHSTRSGKRKLDLRKESRAAIRRRAGPDEELPAPRVLDAVRARGMMSA